MSSHEEAQDMVNYYEQNPASLYGKPVTFYLSQRLMVIEVRDTSSQSHPPTYFWLLLHVLYIENNGQ